MVQGNLFVTAQKHMLVVIMYQGCVRIYCTTTSNPTDTGLLRWVLTISTTQATTSLLFLHTQVKNTPQWLRSHTHVDWGYALIPPVTIYIWDGPRQPHKGATVTAKKHILEVVSRMCLCLYSTNTNKPTDVELLRWVLIVNVTPSITFLRLLFFQVNCQLRYLSHVFMHTWRQDLSSQ